MAILMIGVLCRCIVNRIRLVTEERVDRFVEAIAVVMGIFVAHFAAIIGRIGPDLKGYRPFSPTRQGRCGLTRRAYCRACSANPHSLIA